VPTFPPIVAPDGRAVIHLDGDDAVRLFVGGRRVRVSGWQIIALYRGGRRYQPDLKHDAHFVHEGLENLAGEHVFVELPDGSAALGVVESQMHFDTRNIGPVTCRLRWTGRT
jgi:hypothetical protein